MGSSMVPLSKNCRTRPSKACTRHCTRHFFQPDHFVFCSATLKKWGRLGKTSAQGSAQGFRTRSRTRHPHKDCTRLAKPCGAQGRPSAHKDIFPLFKDIFPNILRWYLANSPWYLAILLWYQAFFLSSFLSFRDFVHDVAASWAACWRLRLVGRLHSRLTDFGCGYALE